MVNINGLVVAAAVALSPFAASALTIQGDFTSPGPNVLAVGESGLGEIILEGSDTGNTTVTFDLTTGPGGRFRGIGNIRRITQFDNLTISFDGAPVSFAPVGANQAIFDFSNNDNVAALVFEFDADPARPLGSIDFDVTAVPLPGALPLLFGAMGGMGLLMSRRKRTA